MNGKFSVDTNIVVPFLNGEPGLLEKFDAAEEICVAPVVVGELLYGAANSARADENTLKIESFLEDATVLEWSSQVSRRYAEIEGLTIESW